jgi:hypothetical protein
MESLQSWALWSSGKHVLPTSADFMSGLRSWVDAGLWTGFSDMA